MSTNRSAASASGSVLRPTKIFLTLGVLLVVAGLCLEGWQRATATNDTTTITVGGHEWNLPGLHLLMPGITVILIAAVIASILVLARGKRHIR
jgi:hypothetical protein